MFHCLLICAINLEKLHGMSELLGLLGQARVQRVDLGLRRVKLRLADDRSIEKPGTPFEFALGLAEANAGFFQLSSRGADFGFGQLQVDARVGVVEASEQLPFPHDHAFLDQNLEHAAGHLR